MVTEAFWVAVVQGPLMAIVVAGGLMRVWWMGLGVVASLVGAVGRE